MSTATATTPATAKKATEFESTRELIESIAVAFMLAFVFKTFLAEAFVIPTGSMAPTLQGRHFDITCPQCGQQYRGGATESTQAFGKNPQCSNCRYQLNDDQVHDDAFSVPYNGDRIIVNKFLYEFDSPQRWDVIVFKYPHDAKTNYIKRLIGLPGETLRIRHGDIYTARFDGRVNTTPYTIARKPTPIKLRAMLQQVHDQNQQSDKLNAAGFPQRWIDWTATARTDGWRSSEDHRSYSVQAGDDTRWLRYRHLLPSTNDWNTALAGRRIDAGQNLPTLINDYYAYNVPQQGLNNGGNWVGDLALECVVDFTDSGAVTLELIKGGRPVRAVIDFAAKTYSLSIPDLPDYRPTLLPTTWPGVGRQRLFFANVDNQLTLLVNDQPVFDAATTGYDELNNQQPIETGFAPGSTQTSDLAPIGIAARNTTVTVTDLRVLRDVYYTAVLSGGTSTDTRQPLDYNLVDHDNDQLDQFLMLGDNSPASSDSRYWAALAFGPNQQVQYFVERRHLMGKAMFIYWPHGWPFSWSFKIPRTDVQVPFYPNLKRMGWIR